MLFDVIHTRRYPSGVSIFPWRSRPTVSHPPITEPQLTPELRQRLEQLEERNRLQEKGLKALELEWQEWYDKYRLMFARLSKRIRDWEVLEDKSTSQDAPGRTIAPTPGRDDLAARARAGDIPITTRRNY